MKAAALERLVFEESSRALFHFVRKCSADRLREVARPRRLAAIVCFLRQSYRDAVDQSVDMFDKFLTRTHTRAEHELSDQMRSQRQTIKAALAALRSLWTIILDDSMAPAALRPRLFAAVPRVALEAQVAGLDEWVTGKKSDVFHGLVRRFSHLSDFALEFYSFIADNYTPFYSMPIECTDRDPAFVLDRLCYNESDLELEEHYTDTHGYTEMNFAAFAMPGRRFCPRIRGLQEQRLYRLDAGRDYGPLAGLVGRADRAIDPQVIAEQWDRMGQLYASLERGHTTASVALKRLASCTAKNRFYRANRDLGRVFKTEFLLSHLSQPQLRSRIRQSLLNVEQLHALARDVYYERRGRINARELHEQMNSCSCLTLILACVIYWQAKEISRVVRWCQPEDVEDKIDITLLEHVSPIEWDNVILYGQHVLDRAQVR